jgi:hypothetical protein
MSKTKTDKDKSEMTIEALILECSKDKYKLPYSAIRWAKEIKKKENSTEPLPALVIRALREILSGKETMKDIEKLPFLFKVPLAPMPPAAPTIKLTPSDDLKLDDEK